MNEVHQIVGQIPAWLDLGPATQVDGVMVREVLGDFSDRLECDRPPKYIIEGDLASLKNSPFDRSETREDVQQFYPGEDIRQLKGRHTGKVAIFFNGYSLAGKDLHKVKAAMPVIGINRTFVGFPGYAGPDPDYVCVVDAEWLKYPEIRRHHGLVNGSVDKDHVGYRATRSFRMSPFSGDLGRDGYPPFVPGTTGFLALELAVYLGFDTVYCLGLDVGGRHFDGTKGSLHFFQMKHHFERLAPKLLDRAKVYVVGSESSRAPFPKITFDEMFA